MVHWDVMWSLHKRASNMEPSTRLGGFEQQTPLISIGVGTNSIWDWGGRGLASPPPLGSYAYDKLLVVFMDQANISESLCFEAPENPQVV